MSGLRGIPTRVVVVTGLLLALLLAGVASYYAASEPDGLSRVALDQGFAATEDQHNDVAPLAGYRTEGVDHDRLSGGLAGVAGCLVVLALAGGVTRFLRARARPEPPASPDSSSRR
jgi:cobalt/nickel transport protein